MGRESTLPPQSWAFYGYIPPLAQLSICMGRIPRRRYALSVLPLKAAEEELPEGHQRIVVCYLHPVVVE